MPKRDVVEMSAFMYTGPQKEMHFLRPNIVEGNLMDKLSNQLEFLAVCDALKTIERQTLLLSKSRQENSAEHSWHSALTALVLFEYCALDGVDIERVVKMIILHDLVEVYAGDSPAMDKSAQIGKEEREKNAADKLFKLLPAEQARDFRAYGKNLKNKIQMTRDMPPRLIVSSHFTITGAIKARELGQNSAPLRK